MQLKSLIDKPKIVPLWRLAAVMRHHRYICYTVVVPGLDERALEAWGYGNTPTEAYNNWKSKKDTI